MTNFHFKLLEEKPIILKYKLKHDECLEMSGNVDSQTGSWLLFAENSGMDGIRKQTFRKPPQGVDFVQGR